MQNRRFLSKWGSVLLLGVVIWSAIPSSPRMANASPVSDPLGERVFEHAAVAADHRIASEAGVEMLKLGGNAVDAAVATSFCLSVVRPYSCGIGGGGFMLIYIPGVDEREATSVAIDYRETAAAAVGPDYYLKLDDRSASRDGVHAVGVPGSVAGLLWALEHYGTLDPKTVLAPAIRVAALGFPADADHVSLADDLRKRIAAEPELSESGAHLWHQLYHDGEIKVGDTISNPAQARALRLIAEQGADAFYRGEIADAIVTTMQANGGPITTEDLASYKVRVVEPLRGSFRGLEGLMCCRCRQLAAGGLRCSRSSDCWSGMLRRSTTLLTTARSTFTSL